MPKSDFCFFTTCLLFILVFHTINGEEGGRNPCYLTGQKYPPWPPCNVKTSRTHIAQKPAQLQQPHRKETRRKRKDATPQQYTTGRIYSPEDIAYFRKHNRNTELVSALFRRSNIISPVPKTKRDFIFPPAAATGGALYDGYDDEYRTQNIRKAEIEPSPDDPYKRGYEQPLDDFSLIQQEDNGMYTKGSIEEAVPLNRQRSSPSTMYLDSIADEPFPTKAALNGAIQDDRDVLGTVSSNARLPEENDMLRMPPQQVASSQVAPHHASSGLDNLQDNIEELVGRLDEKRSGAIVPSSEASLNLSEDLSNNSEQQNNFTPTDDEDEDDLRALDEGRIVDKAPSSIQPYLSPEQQNSRKKLTNGGLAPVLDAGGLEQKSLKLMDPDPMLSKMVNPLTNAMVEGGGATIGNHRATIKCDPKMQALVRNCTNNPDSLCSDMYFMDINAFRRNGLEQHDRFRNVHGTPPLELNEVLNDEAQKYADVLADSAKLSYSDPKERPGQGENIAVRCSDDGSLLTAKEAATYWYDKACNNNNYAPENSQFGQVVWKQTSFLGLGRATKSKKNLLCTYIVARYSPPSTKENIRENVPKGKFSELQFCGKRCDVPDASASSEQEKDGGADERDAEQRGTAAEQAQHNTFASTISKYLLPNPAHSQTHTDTDEGTQKPPSETSNVANEGFPPIESVPPAEGSNADKDLPDLSSVLDAERKMMAEAKQQKSSPSKGNSDEANSLVSDMEKEEQTKQEQTKDDLLKAKKLVKKVKEEEKQDEKEVLNKEKQEDREMINFLGTTGPEEGGGSLESHKKAEEYIKDLKNAVKDTTMDGIRDVSVSVMKESNAAVGTNDISAADFKDISAMFSNTKEDKAKDIHAEAAVRNFGTGALKEEGSSSGKSVSEVTPMKNKASFKEETHSAKEEVSHATSSSDRVVPASTSSNVRSTPTRVDVSKMLSDELRIMAQSLDDDSNKVEAKVDSKGEGLGAKGEINRDNKGENNAELLNSLTATDDKPKDGGSRNDELKQLAADLQSKTDMSKHLPKHLSNELRIFPQKPALAQKLGMMDDTLSNKEPKENTEKENKSPEQPTKDIKTQKMLSKDTSPDDLPTKETKNSETTTNDEPPQQSSTNSDKNQKLTLSNLLSDELKVRFPKGKDNQTKKEEEGKSHDPNIETIDYIKNNLFNDKPSQGPEESDIVKKLEHLKAYISDNEKKKKMKEESVDSTKENKETTGENKPVKIVTIGDTPDIKNVKDTSALKQKETKNIKHAESASFTDKGTKGYSYPEYYNLLSRQFNNIVYLLKKGKQSGIIPNNLKSLQQLTKHVEHPSLLDHHTTRCKRSCQSNEGSAPQPAEGEESAALPSCLCMNSNGEIDNKNQILEELHHIEHIIENHDTVDEEKDADKDKHVEVFHGTEKVVNDDEGDKEPPHRVSAHKAELEKGEADAEEKANSEAHEKQMNREEKPSNEGGGAGGAGGAGGGNKVFLDKSLDKMMRDIENETSHALKGSNDSTAVTANGDTALKEDNEVNGKMILDNLKLMREMMMNVGPSNESGADERKGENEHRENTEGEGKGDGGNESNKELVEALQSQNKAKTKGGHSSKQNDEENQKSVSKEKEMARQSNDKESPTTEKALNDKPKEIHSTDEVKPKPDLLTEKEKLKEDKIKENQPKPNDDHLNQDKVKLKDEEMLGNKEEPPKQESANATSSNTKGGTHHEEKVKEQNKQEDSPESASDEMKFVKFKNLVDKLVTKKINEVKNITVNTASPPPPKEKNKPALEHESDDADIHSFVNSLVVNLANKTAEKAANAAKGGEDGKDTKEGTTNEQKDLKDSNDATDDKLEKDVKAAKAARYAAETKIAIEKIAKKTKDTKNAKYAKEEKIRNDILKQLAKHERELKATIMDEEEPKNETEKHEQTTKSPTQNKNNSSPTEKKKASHHQSDSGDEDKMSIRPSEYLSEILDVVRGNKNEHKIKKYIGNNKIADITIRIKDSSDDVPIKKANNKNNKWEDENRLNAAFKAATNVTVWNMDVEGKGAANAVHNTDNTAVSQERSKPRIVSGEVRSHSHNRSSNIHLTDLEDEYGLLGKSPSVRVKPVNHEKGAARGSGLIQLQQMKKDSSKSLSKSIRKPTPRLKPIDAPPNRKKVLTSAPSQISHATAPKQTKEVDTAADYIENIIHRTDKEEDKFFSTLIEHQAGGASMAGAQGVIGNENMVKQQDGAKKSSPEDIGRPDIATGYDMYMTGRMDDAHIRANEKNEQNMLSINEYDGPTSVPYADEAGLSKANREWLKHTIPNTGIVEGVPPTQAFTKAEDFSKVLNASAPVAPDKTALATNSSSAFIAITASVAAVNNLLKEKNSTSPAGLEKLIDTAYNNVTTHFEAVKNQTSNEKMNATVSTSPGSTENAMSSLVNSTTSHGGKEAGHSLKSNGKASSTHGSKPLRKPSSSKHKPKERVFVIVVKPPRQNNTKKTSHDKKLAKEEKIRNDILKQLEKQDQALKETKGNGTQKEAKSAETVNEAVPAKTTNWKIDVRISKEKHASTGKSGDNETNKNASHSSANAAPNNSSTADVSMNGKNGSHFDELSVQNKELSDQREHHSMETIQPYSQHSVQQQLKGHEETVRKHEESTKSAKSEHLGNRISTKNGATSSSETKASHGKKGSSKHKGHSSSSSHKNIAKETSSDESKNATTEVGTKEHDKQNAMNKLAQPIDKLPNNNIDAEASKVESKTESKINGSIISNKTASASPKDKPKPKKLVIKINSAAKKLNEAINHLNEMNGTPGNNKRHQSEDPENSNADLSADKVVKHLQKTEEKEQDENPLNSKVPQKKLGKDANHKDLKAVVKEHSSLNKLKISKEQQQSKEEDQKKKEDAVTKKVQSLIDKAQEVINKAKSTSEEEETSTVNLQATSDEKSAPQKPTSSQPHAASKGTSEHTEASGKPVGNYHPHVDNVVVLNSNASLHNASYKEFIDWDTDIPDVSQETEQPKDFAEPQKEFDAKAHQDDEMESNDYADLSKKLEQMDPGGSDYVENEDNHDTQHHSTPLPPPVGIEGLLEKLDSDSGVDASLTQKTIPAGDNNRMNDYKEDVDNKVVKGEHLGPHISTENVTTFGIEGLYPEYINKKYLPTQHHMLNETEPTNANDGKKSTLKVPNKRGINEGVSDKFTRKNSNNEGEFYDEETGEKRSTPQRAVETNYGNHTDYYVNMYNDYIDTSKLPYANNTIENIDGAEDEISGMILHDLKSDTPGYDEKYTTESTKKHDVKDAKDAKTKDKHEEKHKEKTKKLASEEEVKKKENKTLDQHKEKSYEKVNEKLDDTIEYMDNEYTQRHHRKDVGLRINVAGDTEMVRGSNASYYVNVYPDYVDVTQPPSYENSYVNEVEGKHMGETLKKNTRKSEKKSKEEGDKKGGKEIVDQHLVSYEKESDKQHGNHLKKNARPMRKEVGGVTRGAVKGSRRALKDMEFDRHGYSLEYDDYVDLTGKMHDSIQKQNTTAESYINGVNEFNYEDVEPPTLEKSSSNIVVPTGGKRMSTNEKPGPQQILKASSSADGETPDALKGARLATDEIISQHNHPNKLDLDQQLLTMSSGGEKMMEKPEFLKEYHEEPPSMADIQTSERMQGNVVGNKSVVEDSADDGKAPEFLKDYREQLPALSDIQKSEKLQGMMGNKSVNDEAVVVGNEYEYLVNNERNFQQREDIGAHDSRTLPHGRSKKIYHIYENSENALKPGLQVKTMENNVMKPGMRLKPAEVSLDRANTQFKRLESKTENANNVEKEVKALEYKTMKPNVHMNKIEEEESTVDQGTPDKTLLKTLFMPGIPETESATKLKSELYTKSSGIMSTFEPPPAIVNSINITKSAAENAEKNLKKENVESRSDENAEQNFKKVETESVSVKDAEQNLRKVKVESENAESVKQNLEGKADVVSKSVEKAEGSSIKEESKRVETNNEDARKSVNISNEEKSVQAKRVDEKPKEEKQLNLMKLEENKLLDGGKSPENKPIESAKKDEGKQLEKVKSAEDKSPESTDPIKPEEQKAFESLKDVPVVDKSLLRKGKARAINIKAFDKMSGTDNDTNVIQNNDTDGNSGLKSYDKVVINLDVKPRKNVEDSDKSTAAVNDHKKEASTTPVNLIKNASQTMEQLVSKMKEFTSSNNKNNNNNKNKENNNIVNKNNNQKQSSDITPLEADQSKMFDVQAPPGSDKGTTARSQAHENSFLDKSTTARSQAHENTFLDIPMPDDNTKLPPASAITTKAVEDKPSQAEASGNSNANPSNPSNPTIDKFPSRVKISGVGNSRAKESEDNKLVTPSELLLALPLSPLQKGEDNDDKATLLHVHTPKDNHHSNEDLVPSLIPQLHVSSSHQEDSIGTFKDTSPSDSSKDKNIHHNVIVPLSVSHTPLTSKGGILKQVDTTSKRYQHVYINDHSNEQPHTNATASLSALKNYGTKKMNIDNMEYQLFPPGTNTAAVSGRNVTVNSNNGGIKVVLLNPRPGNESHGLGGEGARDAGSESITLGDDVISAVSKFVNDKQKQGYYVKTIDRAIHLDDTGASTRNLKLTLPGSQRFHHNWNSTDGDDDTITMDEGMVKAVGEYIKQAEQGKSTGAILAGKSAGLNGHTSPSRKDSAPSSSSESATSRDVTTPNKNSSSKGLKIILPKQPAPSHEQNSKSDEDSITLDDSMMLALGKYIDEKEKEGKLGEEHSLSESGGLNQASVETGGLSNPIMKSGKINADSRDQLNNGTHPKFVNIEPPPTEKGGDHTQIKDPVGKLSGKTHGSKTSEKEETTENQKPTVLNYNSIKTIEFQQTPVLGKEQPSTIHIQKTNDNGNITNKCYKLVEINPVKETADAMKPCREQKQSVTNQRNDAEKTSKTAAKQNIHTTDGSDEGIGIIQSDKESGPFKNINREDIESKNNEHLSVSNGEGNLAEEGKKIGAILAPVVSEQERGVAAGKKTEAETPPPAPDQARNAADGDKDGLKEEESSSIVNLDRGGITGRIIGNKSLLSAAAGATHVQQTNDACPVTGRTHAKQRNKTCAGNKLWMRSSKKDSRVRA